MSTPLCPNCKKNTTVTKQTEMRGKFDVFFCKNCQNGFTYPIPRNLGRYYHDNYWITPGVLGGIKNFLFKYLQKRRSVWIKSHFKKGTILDVGAGEGNFAKYFTNDFEVFGVDSPTAKLQNLQIKKVDFLKWKTKRRFDAVVFWESLEHTPSPQLYLEKANRLLKKGGLVLVEYPRFNGLESKLFKTHWFHLDIPRHLSHLTDRGLVILLKRTNFTHIKSSSISAFEYALWGFTASIIDFFGSKLTDKLKQSENLTIFLLIVPITLISFISEILFMLINESPIGLVTARKKPF